MSKILKEFIKRILEESLLKEEDRDPRYDATGAIPEPPTEKDGPQPNQQQIPSGDFDMKTFLGIPDWRNKINYVNATLKNIGSGSSRVVFQLDGDWVLKLAKNSAGNEQNRAEVTGCHLGSKDFFVQVNTQLSDMKSFNWIVAEKADPMTPDAFKTATGVEWVDFASAIKSFYMAGHKGNRIINQNNPDNNPDKENPANNLVKTSEESMEDFREISKMPFFQGLFRVVAKCSYSVGDLAKLNSWGIIQGKPVIIDSGFTKSVAKNFYTQNPLGTGVIPKDLAALAQAHMQRVKQ